MSDESLPSEQSGTPEQSGVPEQSGTQAFPIVVSATPAEPSAASDLAALRDQSEAMGLARELSHDQQRVLQEMTLGSGITGAAKTTGVSCRTISRWVNENAKFIAALNAWKNEQLESGRASAFAMTDVVMGALRSGIEKGNTPIAFRMADKMGFLGSKAGPIDAYEVERRHQIRQARREDQLHESEHNLDLDLHDRADREEIAWSKRALRRLSFDEQSLLKFLREKAAGRERRDCAEFSPLDHDRHLTPWERNVLVKAREEAVLEGNILFHGHVLPTPRGTNGTLIHYSKYQMFNMLLKGGVKEDEAMQLLANYRRPYPGFLEPDDLPYAEDNEKAEKPLSEQPAEAQSEQADLQVAATAAAPDAGG